MSEYTRGQLERVGGSYWQTSDGSKRRVYFNNIAALYGLTYTTSGSGHINHAELNGETISNSQAARLSAILDTSKLWYDLADGHFYWTTREPNPTEVNEMLRQVINNIKAAL